MKKLLVVLLFCLTNTVNAQLFKPKSGKYTEEDCDSKYRSFPLTTLQISINNSKKFETK